MLAKSKITLLHPHPALLIEEDDIHHLIIADLHIGFEERFKAAGVKLRLSTQAMLNEITEICTQQRIDEIIILGDVKFTVGRVSALERREVPIFLEQVSRLAKTTIVLGNHDGTLSTLIPRGVSLHTEPHMIIRDICLLHGHTKLPELLTDVSRVVMGHIHPTYLREGSVLSGKHVWLVLKVRREALWSKQSGVIEIYVLPPLNRELSYVGFAGRTGKIISPIIRRALKGICDALILTVEGEIVGYVDALPYVI